MIPAELMPPPQIEDVPPNVDSHSCTPGSAELVSGPRSREDVITVGASLAIAQTETPDPQGPVELDSGTNHSGETAQVSRIGGGDDEGGSHGERQSNGEEPIFGIIRESISAEELPGRPGTLLVPTLRTRLRALQPQEFILVAGPGIPTVDPDTVRFDDVPAMAVGLNLDIDESLRVGTLATSAGRDLVVMQSFNHGYDTSIGEGGIDVIVKEDAMAKIINQNPTLANNNIRAAEVLGYCRYATGTVDAETGAPVTKVGIITKYEAGAKTLRNWLRATGERPTDAQLNKAIDMGAGAIGLAHYEGIVLGSPDEVTMLLSSDESTLLISNFEAAAIFTADQQAVWIDINYDIDFFTDSIQTWQREGYISHKQAERLHWRFISRYRSIAYARDSSVPIEGRLGGQ